MTSRARRDESRPTFCLRFLSRVFAFFQQSAPHPNPLPWVQGLTARHFSRTGEKQPQRHRDTEANSTCRACVRTGVTWKQNEKHFILLPSIAVTRKEKGATSVSLCLCVSVPLWLHFPAGIENEDVSSLAQGLPRSAAAGDVP